MEACREAKGEAFEVLGEVVECTVKWVDSASDPGSIAFAFELEPVDECAVQKTRDVDVVLKFESRQVCAWNALHNGYWNLDKVNGKQQARREQSVRALTLAKGEKLCALAMDIAPTRFVYDDAFFLTANGAVVLSWPDWSPSGLLQPHPEVKGAQRYWFPSIRGQPKRPGQPWVAKRTYCYGAPDATCSLPSSEARGELSYSSGEDSLRPFFANTERLGYLNLTQVMTGDDDRSDCQHSGFEVRVRARVALP